MIFRALACDYDGTLATHDRIAPRARQALDRARQAGLRLLLVTGRTFFELTRVCDCLDLFDAVVAENGAVLYFPGPGMIHDEGPHPPSRRLLAELDRRGIYYQVGRVIVGVARSDEEGVHQALAAAGVSLDCVYNRAALMLLPTGVSKGTGVRRVLAALGLSFHDVLGMGDAENDLELFEACGWTACPANAVPALADRADWVLPGEDGEAIAGAIEGSILGGGTAIPPSPRHRLELGWSVRTAEPVTIPARGVNVLIHGDPLSGKSWLAGALVEHLVEGAYAVCVFDPEGDYGVLERLPGVSRVHVRSSEDVVESLGHFEHSPAACIVLDLSDLPHDGKVQAIETGCAAIRELRRRLGRPHWVVIDEAHYSLHVGGIAEDALGGDGKGFCLVSYRPAWIRPSMLRTVDVLILARTTSPQELQGLEPLLAGPSAPSLRALAVLPDLSRGEFLAVRRNETASGSAVIFTATHRTTRHVRHLGKYAESRVSPELAFRFRRADGTIVATADSLNSFRHAMEVVEEDVLVGHAARGDFSRWVAEVLSARDLAAQLRKTELRRTRGEITDLRWAIARLMAVHYGPDR